MWNACLCSRLLFAASRDRKAHTLIHSLVGTAAATLMNLVNMEDGIPTEVRAELLEAGGIEGLVRLLPQGSEVNERKEAARAVAATLAALSVDPEIANEIYVQGGVERLVAMLQAGARSETARHSAAILGRMAKSSVECQTAIREAGGIEQLAALCEDALDTWAVSEEDEQAAQHGAGALWLLASEPKSCDLIAANAGAVKALASFLDGRYGRKAEGNAAGALLAMSKHISAVDPDSVLAAVQAP